MMLSIALLPWLLSGLGNRYRYLLVLASCFLFFGLATRNRNSTPDTDNYIDFINWGSTNGGLYDAEFLASKIFKFYSTYLNGELFILSATIIPFVMLVYMIDNGRKASSYFFPVIFISTLYGFDLMTNAVRQNVALVTALWLLTSHYKNVVKLGCLATLDYFIRVYYYYCFYGYFRNIYINDSNQ